MKKAILIGLIVAVFVVWASGYADASSRKAQPPQSKPQVKSPFDAMDANHNGEVTKAEFDKYQAKMAARRAKTAKSAKAAKVEKPAKPAKVAKPVKGARPAAVAKGRKPQKPEMGAGRPVKHRGAAQAMANRPERGRGGYADGRAMRRQYRGGESRQRERGMAARGAMARERAYAMTPQERSLLQQRMSRMSPERRERLRDRWMKATPEKREKMLRKWEGRVREGRRAQGARMEQRPMSAPREDRGMRNRQGAPVRGMREPMTMRGGRGRIGEMGGTIGTERGIGAGNMTPEQRMRIMRQLWNGMTPEERRAMARELRGQGAAPERPRARTGGEAARGQLGGDEAAAPNDAGGDDVMENWGFLEDMGLVGR